MKTLFVLASVMVVLLLAVPNKVEAQKRKAATRIIEGTISSYDCGDNCYLTITDKNGKEHKGLCAASICTKWGWGAMPDSYKGRRVRVTIGKGKRLSGAGEVIGPMDAFTRVQFTESEPILAQERRPDACTFCGVWEYNEGGSKRYLKITNAGMGKVKLIEGFESQGKISWHDYFMYKGKLSGFDGVMIRNADGIYLKPINGRLVGTFVSPNFYATHGAEFTYKITCTLQSNDQLLYSVWSSIRGVTNKQIATRISN